MRHAENLDETIRLAHQRIAEAVQRTTEVDAFVLSKFCFIVLAVFSIAGTARTLNGPPSMWQVFSLAWLMVTIAGIHHLFRVIDRIAARCRQGYYNESMGMRKVRLTVTVLCLPLFYAGTLHNIGLAALLFLCCVMGFYFMACTPLPPGTRFTKLTPARSGA